ncbi:GRAS family protein RAM1-like [Aristolochia californica]|uniref:GRAS family protein RAM1-like n=1 Tax=Aristolochia californica TaxID=171875 RepID=UPI0035E32754
MHDDAEDELLDLRLAVAVDSGGGGEKKRKRDENTRVPQNYQVCLDDDKMFEFLRVREVMLKLDPKRVGVEDGKGLHLIHLLLISATAIDEKKLCLAADNLTDLYKNVSLKGDSIQRVAAYFADGLAARLLSRQSPFYSMIMKEPTPEEEFAAFTELYRASPYYQFAHFTANQAIIEAFEKEESHNNRTLHVVDFDVSYGFQWPSLIQSLSDKATSSKRIHLHITGFGTNSEELKETETRLVNFAKGCLNLDFKFEWFLTGTRPVGLQTNKNDTVAVNLMFYLHRLGSSSKIYEALKSVYSLNPSVVVLVEQEGSRNPKSFLSRFMESLHYFAAMFDSLDDCLPPDSSERLRIERNQLGREIKSMLNGDKDEENHQRFERLETWKGRMERVGFRGFKLSSRSLSQAKLLLKIRCHWSAAEFDHGAGGFKVFEKDGGRALSLGWQDRHLITASVWHCV